MNTEAMTLTLTDDNGEHTEVLVLFKPDGIWVKCADPKYEFEDADPQGWKHFTRLSIYNKQEIIRQVWGVKRAG